MLKFAIRAMQCLILANVSIQTDSTLLAVFGGFSLGVIWFCVDKSEELNKQEEKDKNNEI